MPIPLMFKVAPAQAVLVSMLFLSTIAQAANMPLAAGAWREPLNARFDTTTRETRVTAQVSSELCFSFLLPQEWRAVDQGAQTRLKAALSDTELTLSLRSARELQDMPQPDLASRDAAFLQRGYEDLLGRPAQSVSLVSSVAGATRWSATWVDANLPSASHAMTVEAFIVPLSKEWVLELSVSNIEEREVYDALVQRILDRLRVQGSTGC